MCSCDEAGKGGWLWRRLFYFQFSSFSIPSPSPSSTIQQHHQQQLVSKPFSMIDLYFRFQRSFSFLVWRNPSIHSTPSAGGLIEQRVCDYFKCSAAGWMGGREGAKSGWPTDFIQNTAEEFQCLKRFDRMKKVESTLSATVQFVKLPAARWIQP